ncbi:MAG TPA: isochorismatase family protein [Chloroflexota bacterium]|nr:isochorismatase family protein [Chloroflexota bacterium]
MTGQSLSLTLRTYLRHPEPGIECVESRFHHAEWTVEVPAQQAAVVLVDVWDTHAIASHAARTAEIARTKIAPVLAAGRAAGVAVIHAPSPVQARRYAQWVRCASEDDACAPAISAWPFLEPGDWPPPAFRRREGEFRQFRRPVPPAEPALRAEREARRIDPSVEPQADDCVVATGAQLHRLCEDRGILHLFYAGFATNICIPFKDYGVRAFSARGYNVMLLRDCTTAIEGHDTVAELRGTQQAIRELEMAGLASTLTSDDFIAACAAAATTATTATTARAKQPH